MAAADGFVDVFYSLERLGIPLAVLPQELGCGSGMTCWRRLRDWQGAGALDLIHFALLAQEGLKTANE